MRIIVSTDNKNKLKEIKALLGEKVEILSKSDAGFAHIHPVEEGDTLEANAKIKIEPIAANGDEIVIGDDTGLFVDALEGEPGIYSARYAGEEHDDAANRKRLLHELKNVTDRSAYFKTVIAVKFNDEIRFVEGICRGQILVQEKGENGFGYDSLFVPEGYAKTFAEMDDEEKNKVSHRGEALRELKKLLKLEKLI